MPLVRICAGEKAVVYKYWHIADIYPQLMGRPFSPVDGSQLRHPAYLVAILRPGIETQSQVCFVHSGRQGLPAEFGGRQPHYTAADPHGSCFGDLATGELHWVKFNWAGRGYPEKMVRFIRLHPAWCLGVHVWQKANGQIVETPWCVIHRRLANEERDTFWAWLDSLPNYVAPERDVRILASLCEMMHLSNEIAISFFFVHGHHC